MTQLRLNFGSKPLITYRVVINVCIVNLDREAKVLCAQRTDGGHELERRHHQVPFGADQTGLGIEQFLLRIQHIKDGARTDFGLLLHPVQRDGGGADSVRS